MMDAKHLILAGLIAAMSIFSGCAGKVSPHRETKLEKNWGTSFKTARDNQILNPKAGENLEPVLGLDGQGAEGAMKTYQNGFKSKEASKSVDINLGSIDSIGKK